MTTVVMLLTFVACVLALIGFVVVLLLSTLSQVLHAIVRQNLYLVEWKETFDATFVVDEFGDDDSEEEEIRGWN